MSDRSDKNTTTIPAGALLPERATAAPPQPDALSVAYRDGQRLMPAARASGGAGIRIATGVRVRVDAPACTNAPGTGGTAALWAVNAHFRVRDGRSVPFHAWTAAPHGRPAVTFPMPVDPAKGVTLSVESGAGEHPCRFLREGVYVIALDPAPAWLLCRFDPAQTDAPLIRRTRPGPVPVDFDYVVVTVARA